jgi:hypothetical protein
MTGEPLQPLPPPRITTIGELLLLKSKLLLHELLPVFILADSPCLEVKELPPSILPHLELKVPSLGRYHHI